MPKKPTTAQLIAKWRAFVEQLEAGYSFGLYDYRNDLDLRSLIEAAGAADQVADLDARFRAATHKRKLKVWESDSEDPFWVYGVPRRISAAFKEDLKSEGLS